MIPVYENAFDSAPIESLIEKITFYKGQATVRNYPSLPAHAADNQLHASLLGRLGEIRSNGYHTLVTEIAGHVYLSIYRRDMKYRYWLDKYGAFWPLLGLLLCAIGALSLAIVIGGVPC